MPMCEHVFDHDLQQPKENIKQDILAAASEEKMLVINPWQCHTFIILFLLKEQTNKSVTNTKSSWL